MCVHEYVHALLPDVCLYAHTVRGSVCLPYRRLHARRRVCMCGVCARRRSCVLVCAKCVCVYARTVATSITQSRELQSVKSTLTFMVLTSQGHPKAEHLEWSVTFQTENNSRVFRGLWRRLFILPLTLIHFDLARGNNGLNTLIFPPLVCSRCLSFACRLPLAVSLFSQKNVPVMTWSLDIKQK